MSLMPILTYHYSQFLKEQENIKSKNEQKIQEAIDLYWRACDFPRKTKKKMRKQANFDYSFWKGVQKWHNDFINF